MFTSPNPSVPRFTLRNKRTHIHTYIHAETPITTDTHKQTHVQAVLYHCKVSREHGLQRRPVPLIWVCQPCAQWGVCVTLDQ